jgi:hypothetical protein
VRASLFEGAGIEREPSPEADLLQEAGTLIDDVLRGNDAMTVQLRPGSSRRLGNPESILFVERIDDDRHGVGYRVYAPSPGNRAGRVRNTIHANLTDEVRSAGGGRNLLVSSALVEALPVGAVVAFRPDTGVVVDWWPGFYSWKAIDARVLQNRTRTRALVVPVTAGASVALQPGNYRLTFMLERERWSTTAPADSSNHYRAEASVALAW